MARGLLTFFVLLSQLFNAEASIYFKNVGGSGYDDTSMISGSFYRKKINDTAITGNPTLEYDASIFQTHITGGNFTYTISGLNPGQYDLKLGFAENYKGNCDVGNRVFNVTYNGGQEFEYFLDVYSHVRCYTAYIKTKTVTTDAAGQIVLDFKSSPGKNFPFVSLIEVDEAYTQVKTDTAPMLFFHNAGAADEDISVVKGDSYHFFSDDIVSNTGDYGQLVFKSHRYGAHFSYQLQGFSSTMLYSITLGFAEVYSPNCVAGARVMNVKVDQQDFAKDLDVFAAVGCNTAYVLTKTFAPSSEGKFTIEFTAQRESPMVSFIRVDEGYTTRRFLRAAKD